MTHSSTTKYSLAYVEEKDALDKLLRHLDAVSTVYLDLEADSMHHFYAKICLIQILVEDCCYLVDPLSKIPLDNLLKKLAGKIMVLHGADYDLRMLYQQYRFRPLRVFDTMLSAQLLGKPGFGLAALVKAYFDVSLRKDQQKADWSQRPLPPLMLEYGAQDTYFLPGLHSALTEEMAAKNRVEWHAECCRELILATARSKEVDLENAWRIDGSARLAPRQLSVLKALWKFRDQEARARDLPSYKILPSDLLLRFSLSVPMEGAPEKIPTLPSRLSPVFKTGFLDHFHEALELPPATWPQPWKPLRKTTPSPNAALMAQLKNVRDKIAAELELDPSLLATKSTLTSVALSDWSSREKVREAANWMKWQEDLLLEPWMEGLRRP